MTFNLLNFQCFFVYPVTSLHITRNISFWVSLLIYQSNVFDVLNNVVSTYYQSAGVGRTGTYIALDILTEEGKDLGSVDVFNCVNKMRGQRVNMVQTGVSIILMYVCLKSCFK
jgi:protein tyrosine phosphatase